MLMAATDFIQRPLSPAYTLDQSSSPLDNVVDSGMRSNKTLLSFELP
jgi:hypothetical protein